VRGVFFLITPSPVICATSIWPKAAAARGRIRGLAAALKHGRNSSSQPRLSYCATPRPEQRRAAYRAQQQGAYKPFAVARERSRAWAATSARSPDTVLHRLETTGGHAVPPAAGGVLHRLETTGGHAEAVGHGYPILPDLIKAASSLAK
jgi:hypothetical protein